MAELSSPGRSYFGAERKRLPACPDQSGATDGKDPRPEAANVLESKQYF